MWFPATLGPARQIVNGADHPAPDAIAGNGARFFACPEVVANLKGKWTGGGMRRPIPILVVAIVLGLPKVAHSELPAQCLPPIAKAKLHSYQQPMYPPESVKLGEQGTTVLDIVLDGQVVPTDVKVATSSGYPRLDDAAVVTIKQSFRFEPTGPQCPDGEVIRIPLAWNLKAAR